MRAVLIDDHQLFRDGLRRLVEDQFDFDEVIDAGSIEEGRRLLSQVGTADLIVVDLQMPGSSGPESIRMLAEAFPEAKVVVMSASEAKPDILGSISAGVDGYVPKSLPVPEIVSAINQVLSGSVYIPKSFAQRGEGRWRPAASPPSGVEHLTSRQKEVLGELLHGRSSKEIARSLRVAEGTVKIHLAAIYRALGVKSRAEAIARLAYRN